MPTNDAIFELFQDGTPYVESGEFPGYGFTVGERTLQITSMGDRVVYSASINDNETMMGFVDTKKAAEELRIWLISGVEPASWRPTECDDGDGVAVGGYVMLAGLLFISSVAITLSWRWFHGG